MTEKKVSDVTGDRVILEVGNRALMLDRLECTTDSVYGKRRTGSNRNKDRFRTLRYSRVNNGCLRVGSSYPSSTG